MTAEALSLRVLALHFAATFYMVGLVWFVPRVHDRLFALQLRDLVALWMIPCASAGAST